MASLSDKIDLLKQKISSGLHFTFCESNSCHLLLVWGIKHKYVCINISVNMRWIVNNAASKRKLLKDVDGLKLRNMERQYSEELSVIESEIEFLTEQLKVNFYRCRGL